MKFVEIFTDGACRGNPGPGGWAALLRYKGNEKEISGYEPNTTNNRMELQAAIEALKALQEPCKIKLLTDSEYLRQGISTWIKGWKANGWRTSSKTPVKNADLWQMLDEQNQRHDIEWCWVRGHNGHHENTIVDRLAREAIDAGMQINAG